MSTRSRIAIQQANGGYSSIYHHWDGSPEELGVNLKILFPTRLNASGLIAKGDISSIDLDSGAVDYYTERGEAFTEVQPVQSKNLDELLKLTDECNGAYVYIYYLGGNGPVCYTWKGVEITIPAKRKVA